MDADVCPEGLPAATAERRLESPASMHPYMRHHKSRQAAQPPHSHHTSTLCLHTALTRLLLSQNAAPPRPKSNLNPAHHTTRTHLKVGLAWLEAKVVLKQDASQTVRLIQRLAGGIECPPAGILNRWRACGSKPHVGLGLGLQGGRQQGARLCGQG